MTTWPRHGTATIWPSRVLVTAVAMAGEGRHVWGVGLEHGRHRHLVMCGDPTNIDAHDRLWAELATLWQPDLDQPTQLICLNQRTIDLLRMSTQLLARRRDDPATLAARAVAWWCWRSEYAGAQATVPIVDRMAEVFGIDPVDTDAVCAALGVDSPERTVRIRQHPTLLYADAADDLYTGVDADREFLQRAVRAREGRARSAAAAKSQVRPLLQAVLHNRLDRLGRIVAAVEAGGPFLPDLDTFAAADSRAWTDFWGWGYPRQITDLADRTFAVERWDWATLSDPAVRAEAVVDGKVLVGTMSRQQLTTLQTVTRARAGDAWEDLSTGAKGKVVGSRQDAAGTVITFDGEFPDGPITLTPPAPSVGMHANAIRRKSARLREAHWLRDRDLGGNVPGPRTPTVGLLDQVWALRGQTRPPASHADAAVEAALEAVDRGDRAVVCPAPPGAGKSWLVEAIAATQAQAGNRVLICTQTNAQGAELANRIDAAFAGVAIRVLHAASGRPSRLGDHIWGTSKADQLPDEPGIVVATASKAEWVDPATWSADLLILDEAWQATWAQLQVICGLAPRLVAVGDHLQLPPVMVADVRRWDGRDTAPHRAAPEVLLQADVATVVAMPATRRFGAQTADLLSAAFYPPGQSFGSLATPTLEPASSWWPSVEVARAVVPADQVIDSVVAAVDDALAHGLDVGVVVPHVSLVADYQSRLPAEVMVDTTERWQGLERDLVVVPHPMAVEDPTAFELDGGRMCVAMSRHRDRCLIVEPDDLEARLVAASGYRPDSPGLAAHHLLSRTLPVTVRA